VGKRLKYHGPSGAFQDGDVTFEKGGPSQEVTAERAKVLLGLPGDDFGEASKEDIEQEKKAAEEEKAAAEVSKKTVEEEEDAARRRRIYYGSDTQDEIDEGLEDQPEGAEAGAESPGQPDVPARTEPDQAEQHAPEEPSKGKIDSR
jgi:hypothetical protein